jgi:hypothetical protein
MSGKRDNNALEIRVYVKVRFLLGSKPAARADPEGGGVHWVRTFLRIESYLWRGKKIKNSKKKLLLKDER